jgi:predicted phage tail protein
MELYRPAPRWRSGLPGRSRWRLGAVAGIFLAAVLVGWPLAGPSYALTALSGQQAKATDPGPPTGLAATAGDLLVKLSWTPPASDGGTPIIGYDVYLGTSSQGESAVPVNVSLIAATSYQVAGLTDGTTYYFTVEAVNDANLHSAASAQASATPPATAPASPTGLVATAGSARVSLSWTAPASAGGARITSYDVYEGTTAAVKLTAPVTSAKGTSATVTGLTDGTRYYFKVTAVNQVGAGPASGAASAIPAAPITAPGSPTGLTAVPGRGRVTLSWTPPASDGGAAISGYVIYAGTSPDGASTTLDTSANTTSYQVAGLTNGTTYYFLVAAVNDANRQGRDSGEASATPVSGSASASPTPRAAGTPTGLAATAGNPSKASAGTTPKVTLAAKKVPEPVIIALAAIAVAATAGALALGAWRLRLRSRPPLAPPPEVRAGPDTDPPGLLSADEIGTDEMPAIQVADHPDSEHPSRAEAEHRQPAPNLGAPTG